MEKFPSEIIFDILSRLPIESLSKAKYVCKLWNSIVNTPSFATAHLSHSKNRAALIVVPRHRIPTDPFFVLHPNDPEPEFLRFPIDSGLSMDYFIQSSINGILCLSSTTGTNTTTRPIWLYNPVLNESFVLPLSPHGFIYLHCDETYGCRTTFACDPSSGEYKVYRFFFKQRGFHADDNYYISEICTVRINGVDPACVIESWRPMTNPPHKIVTYKTYCFLNGRLHWLARRSDNTECIVFLDVQHEKFGVLPAPIRESGRFLEDIKFMVFRGCLCIFEDCPREHCVNIWIMKEYGVSWVKEYKITSWCYHEYGNYDFFICMMNDEKVLISLFAGIICYDYDFKSDVFGEHRILYKYDKYSASFTYKFPHTCSIISLKGVGRK